MRNDVYTTLSDTLIQHLHSVCVCVSQSSLDKLS